MRKVIRAYTPGDLPAIVEIANQAWQPIYRMFRHAYGDELFELLVPQPATGKGEQVRAHCLQHPDWVLVSAADISTPPTGAPGTSTTGTGAPESGAAGAGAPGTDTAVTNGPSTDTGVDAVQGFAIFRLDPARSLGELGNNAVRPELRGRGLAQELYAAVLDRFRQEGLRYAKVHTGLDQAHAAARRAYQKAGFDIRHEDVDYYMKL